MKKANTNYKRDLDLYFDSLIKNCSSIPCITDIQNKTGISAPTISRYAKKIGFYSFADLRSTYMKTINERTKISLKAKKLLDFLRGNAKFAIVTSLSTRAVGEFLADRLKAMKYDVIIAKNDLSETSNRASIIITISGESLRTSNFLRNHKTNVNRLLITCVKSNSKDAISLDEYMYRDRTINELFKTLRNVNEWIQKTLDVASAESWQNA